MRGLAMIQENGHDGGRNRSMLHLSDWVDPYIGSIGHLLTATQPLVYLPHSLAQIRPVTDEKTTMTSRTCAATEERCCWRTAASGPDTR